jgi:DNA-binding beta-propeller fold protein YncE
VDLHPLEYVVEDFESPAHAVKVMHGHSVFTNLRDGLITFAYGRENSLQSPTHVATDSKQRLIVSDPDRQAVHVLDITNKSSFRIAGGPKRRLQAPGGIAIDADDNIYVADEQRGVVLVYDPQGRFLRYLGTYRGESMFQSPSGIAIDRDARVLYVLDSPANELLMISLQGRLLKRIGGRYPEKSSARFEYPTEIALRDHQLAILDLYGSRIQILDLQGNHLNEFNVRTLHGLPVISEIGLALDSAGNIYISNLDGSDVQVFGQDGRRIGAFGKPGFATEEFRVPSGLWIDSEDRMFVADTRNSRVQVFRVAETSQAPQDAARN